MTDNNLPEKLLEDLGKSGFGSELAALRMFHRGPFRTVAGKVYFDDVLNCQRAIDLSAEKTEHSQNALTHNWMCIVLIQLPRSKLPFRTGVVGDYARAFHSDAVNPIQPQSDQASHRLGMRDLKKE